MKCPHCGSDIQITHSYSAGTEAKTQSGRCEGCKRVYTLVTTIMHEVTKRGQGAFAVAKKLKSKKKGIGLEKD